MSVDSDLLAMLEGWDSKEVVLGDFTGRGLVETIKVLDTDRSGDPVFVERTVLRLQRSSFVDADGVSTVSRGDTVTVDGIAYSVTAEAPSGITGGLRAGEEVDNRDLLLFVRKV